MFSRNVDNVRNGKEWMSQFIEDRSGKLLRGKVGREE